MNDILPGRQTRFSATSVFGTVSMSCCRKGSYVDDHERICGCRVNTTLQLSSPAVIASGIALPPLVWGLSNTERTPILDIGAVRSHFGCLRRP